jgi:diaminopimelate decarboxylase
VIHVRAIAGTSGVFSGAHFDEGEIILTLPRLLVEHPTTYTVQVDEGRHVDTTDSPARFLNHSCDPSCGIDAERYAVIALRDIAPGDELTFNYLTTEWDMASPFRCACGSPRCAGMIRGYRHLDAAGRAGLVGTVLPFLLRRAEAERSDRHWWLGGALEVDERGLLWEGLPVSEWASKERTPLYLYSGATIRLRLSELKGALDATGSQRRISYAMKANRFPGVLQIIREEGDVGVDCCSPRELARARECGFRPEEITITTSWQSDRDLRAYAAAGVHVNLDSLSALRRWAAIPGARREVGFRLDPEASAGWWGNERLSYGNSKFGFVGSAVHEALALAKKLDIAVTELHVHMGWGLQANTAATLDSVFARLAELAAELPQVETINVGGGLGWRQQAQDAPLSPETWSKLLTRRLGPLGRRIACEPGTYVTASAGILLVEVNSLEWRRGMPWIGVDAGHNVNGYAANYGIPHALIHGRAPLAEPDRSYVVAGNINEAIDVFSRGVSLPTVEEGDLLAFFPAGAYGASMASDHCMRGGVREVLVP